MRTDGWTDGHDEANRHFLQFCERAKNKQLVTWWDLYDIVTYVTTVLFRGGTLFIVIV